MNIEMDGVDINYRRSKERVENQLGGYNRLRLFEWSIRKTCGIITSRRDYKANIRKKPYTFL